MQYAMKRSCAIAGYGSKKLSVSPVTSPCGAGELHPTLTGELKKLLPGTGLMNEVRHELMPTLSDPGSTCAWNGLRKYHDASQVLSGKTQLDWIENVVGMNVADSRCPAW